MVFVSSRCSNFVEQPRGGYLGPKLFKTERVGGEELPEGDGRARRMAREH